MKCGHTLFEAGLGSAFDCSQALGQIQQPMDRLQLLAGQREEKRTECLMKNHQCTFSVFLQWACGIVCLKAAAGPRGSLCDAASAVTGSDAYDIACMGIVPCWDRARISSLWRTTGCTTRESMQIRYCDVQVLWP